MKTSTLLDANIPIDVPGTGRLADVSRRAVISGFDSGKTVLGAIRWFELACRLLDERFLFDRIAWTRAKREYFPNLEILDPESRP